MGRKAKFSKETKLKIIEEFYKRSKSVTEIAYEYGFNERQLYYWVKSYEIIGENAFDEKPKNNSYSKELKLAAIKDYLEGKGSIEEIAKNYGIYNQSTLLNWIMKYNSHKEIKDYEPKGDVYMTKSNKASIEEKREIVKYCLNNDKSYKLAAEKYNQPYHLIYQWVQKYLEQGEQGLEDNRGRKKIEEELSEADKLKRENERLKAQNIRLQMENELIKKMKELERREALIRLGKKQNMKR